ncbi:588fc70a-b4d3-47e8-93fb-448cc0a0d845 [Thermothielavioides terrestris]|uniref:588fc70a-b4d3-47e8-93fb-448cc0a0d845 n=2 Tax=Thermothielavioides terrestris TaxID=2587410 RepID=A0A3S4BN19_9PEZI|nr:588fc70a-b4d3-47e8-93fb-448cc0a0d845 [Thermothielavioides terrestris]
MHENSFVHRDLKPQNILVVYPGPDWLVQISDFGISRRLDEDNTVTKNQGTLGFMAPETLGLIPEGSSPYAMDIWSLGALLFVVLTKERFLPDRQRHQDYASGNLAAADREAEMLRTSGVSEQCARFLRCMLAPSPDDRPSSDEASKHGWLAEPRETGGHQGSARHGGEGSAGRATPYLAPEEASTAGASATWSSTHVATPQPIAAETVDLSRLLASASFDGTIKLWDWTTWQCRWTKRAHRGIVQAVAFLPNSPGCLASASGHNVKYWEVATGQYLQTVKESSDSGRATAFSPDRQSVAFATGQPFFKTIEVRKLAAAHLGQTLKGHRGFVNSLAFSPDSRLLASASDDNTVRVWVLATGTCRWTLDGHRGRVTSVAFSPDSRQLASGSDDNTIRIWVLGTGRRRLTLRGHGGTVKAVVFSPLHDSRLLASASADRTVKLWDVAQGDCKQTLEGHGDTVIAAAFSPHARLVASASADKTVKVWDPVTGACLRTLEGHSDTVSCVAFPSDLGLVTAAAKSSLALAPPDRTEYFGTHPSLAGTDPNSEVS